MKLFLVLVACFKLAAVSVNGLWLSVTLPGNRICICVKSYMPFLIKTNIMGCVVSFAMVLFATSVRFGLLSSAFVFFFFY